jgi:hypothetical protein
MRAYAINKRAVPLIISYGTNFWEVKLKKSLKPGWSLHVAIKTIVTLFVLLLSLAFNSFSHTFAMTQRTSNPSYHVSAPYRVPNVKPPNIPNTPHEPVIPTPGSKVLDLAIDLAPRNQSALDALLVAQSNPTSPLYHHYLTPSEFKSQFGQTPAAVADVVSFLKSKDLNVTSISPNNLLLKATGTVAVVNKAFALKVNNYVLSSHVVFAPTADPEVPDTLAPIIQNITGLDNLSNYKPRGLNRAPKKMVPHAGPGGGYTPSDLRTAYDVNPLLSAGATGAGQTVALFELDGYNPSDINAYLSNYALGPAKYSNVLVDGATNTPGSGAIEVSLDMEVASAMAPDASQKIYIGPNSTNGVNDLYNRIVTDDIAKVTSTSWGQCEANSGNAELNTLNNIFKQGAAQGQTFFAASGDSGAYDCGGGNSVEDLSVDSPADQPYVVGVGGTNLVTGTSGTYGSESAWSIPSQNAGGGGGTSTFFTRPAYQSGSNLTSTNRTVPDVSADADPASGYSIYCSGDSSYCTGWGEIGGTSAAAPLWVGIAADINQYLLAQKQTPLGNVDAALYTLYNTSQPYAPYHDVTTGTNLYYQAGTGYDLATGIGTPNAWNIARDIAGSTGGTPTPTPTPRPIVTPTPTPRPIVTPTPRPIVTPTPGPIVTPTPGPIVTPTPGPVVTPPPGGLTTQLLQNGGFEQGNMRWGQRSVRGYNFINQVNPHTGKYSADLCGYANCNDALYQTVNLPRTTTHVTLSYWVYTGNRSTSTSCSSEFYVILSTASGSPLSLVQLLCNTDAHGWTHYSFDLSSILAKDAGQPIQLYFNARAFTRSAASFYVDDVAFNVTTSS